jgi:hypothetical protein
MEKNMKRFLLKEFIPIDLIRIEQVYKIFINQKLFLTYSYGLPHKKQIYKIKEYTIPRWIFNIFYKFKKSDIQKLTGYIMDNLTINIIDDGFIIMEADKSVMDIVNRFKKYIEKEITNDIYFDDYNLSKK